MSQHMTGKVRDNNRLSVFSLRIYNLSCIMCFVDSFDCQIYAMWIMNVKGIGSKTLETMRGQVTVG